MNEKKATAARIVVWRLESDGTICIVDNVAEEQQVANELMGAGRPVRSRSMLMSRRQFDRLPDFGGWQ